MDISFHKREHKHRRLQLQTGPGKRQRRSADPLLGKQTHPRCLLSLLLLLRKGNLPRQIHRELMLLDQPRRSRCRTHIRSPRRPSHTLCIPVRRRSPGTPSSDWDSLAWVQQLPRGFRSPRLLHDQSRNPHRHSRRHTLPRKETKSTMITSISNMIESGKKDCLSYISKYFTNHKQYINRK